MGLAKRSADESGVALITALLAIMLMSALMVGMFAALATDQRSLAMDRDQTQAYAAAQAGLEKLTSGLAQLFVTDVSPSVTQINAVATTPPVIPGFSFTAPGGTAGSGYTITWPGAPANPVATSQPITTGPFTGFVGLITKYTATITARSSTGGAEVRLRRDLQTVAVPVFQFGIFSDSDLSIFAGEDFSFGGRVHTNGSLFVCEQTGSGWTMTFTDRITALNEVVHNYYSNGLLNSTSTPKCTGEVLIPTSPSTNRNLKQSPNEGSITGMPPVPWTPAAAALVANPDWPTISTGAAYYKSYIRTSLTGAKRLDLPLVSQGATPVDLIRRPALNSAENTANAPVYGQRYYAQASLRILLSDRDTDLTGLPTITGTAPVLLDGNWLNAAAPPVGRPVGYVVDATHPPIARSPGPMSINTSNNCCGTNGTINLAGALPAAFQIPSGVNLRIGSALAACDAKNATQFLECTLSVNVFDNDLVTATLPSGITVTTTVNGAESASTTHNRTIDIDTPPGGVATFKTAPFSVNTFFINGSLYTCTNYDTTGTVRFSGCTTSPKPSNNATITSNALATQNTGTIGGYIKIEKQNAAGSWTDVTTEILNLGIGETNQQGTICADPTPNAVLRIQRLRDNNFNGVTCGYEGTKNPWDWWPNGLYDAREGSLRDLGTTEPMRMGGIMQYVALDVGNLKKWFAGTTGTTGTAALNNNGYIVYFSDRRGNHDSIAGFPETGEYGFEDHVNPGIDDGLPDGVLQTGEDVNYILPLPPIPPPPPTQEVYGKVPWNNAGFLNGGTAPYAADNASTPWTTMPAANEGQARVNKVVLFRRALKLVNGGIGNLPASGLTVAAENPVYVHGNYNASTPANSSVGILPGEAHAPASIVADAITLLSRNWNDYKSFDNPNSTANRQASTTGWRFAAVAGKGLSFNYCGAACGSPGQLFGTDGGAASFLRLLEDWYQGGGSGISLNYRGSLITLHINRQATGTYKWNGGTHIYTGGIRNFAFDTDFLTWSLLPPGTPMFRDINTLKFRQILRPNQ